MQDNHSSLNLLLLLPLYTPIEVIEAYNAIYPAAADEDIPYTMKSCWPL